MSAKTAFRLAWERRLERDSADDVVMDVLELAMGERLYAEKNGLLLEAQGG